MKSIIFASALALIASYAQAHPVHHATASVCQGGCNAGANIPLGKMQTNPNAWNYGMIHIEGGWSITPKSGWYTFTNNMLTFAADLPALMGGNSSAVSALSQSASHNHAPFCHVGRLCR